MNIDELYQHFLIPDPGRAADRTVKFNLTIGVIYLAGAVLDEVGNPLDWFGWVMLACGLVWLGLAAWRYRERRKLREQVQESNRAFRAEWGRIAANLAAMEEEEKRGRD